MALSADARGAQRPPREALAPDNVLRALVRCRRDEEVDVSIRAALVLLVQPARNGWPLEQDRAYPRFAEGADQLGCDYVVPKLLCLFAQTLWSHHSPPRGS